MINGLEQGGRVRVIDAIRGFSLLGILIANMLIFQYGLYGKDEMAFFNPSGLDNAAHAVLKVIVEESFMPIFMFLFGYSLYKLRDSLVQKGLKPWRSLVRRFALLMGLGLMHSMFLWEGDILLAYGMMGFVLFLFIKRKPKTLIIWAVILSVLLASAGYGMNETTPKDADTMTQYVEQSIPIYSSGTYKAIKDFRHNEHPYDQSDIMLALMLLITPLLLAPMFLFGLAAARKQWFHNPKQERGRYIWIAGICLPLGILFKSISVWHEEWAFGGIFYTLGAQLLAFGYIFAFAIMLSALGKNAIIVSAFEAVGRMSLTNYLMQTVICTTIFYGYGVGWFGQIGVLNGLLLALLIYAIQAATSRYMLGVVRNGPVERLMRMWTNWTLSGRAEAKSKVVKGVDLDAG